MSAWSHAGIRGRGLGSVPVPLDGGDPSTAAEAETGVETEAVEGGVARAAEGEAEGGAGAEVENERFQTTSSQLDSRERGAITRHTRPTDTDINSIIIGEAAGGEVEVIVVPDHHHHSSVATTGDTHVRVMRTGDGVSIDNRLTFVFCPLSHIHTRLTPLPHG